MNNDTMISPSLPAGAADARLIPSDMLPEPPGSDGVPLRTCRVCKQDLPLTEFGPKHDRTDGLESQCRSCYNKYANEWKRKNKDKCRRYAAKSATRTKTRTPEDKPRTCTVCKELLPLSAFGAQRDTSDGVAKRCRKCARAYQLKWQSENRERCRAYTKKNYDKNPEAAMLRVKRRKAADPEKFRAYTREQNRKQKDYQREYVKQRRATDPQYRIASSLRGRLNDALKGKQKQGSAVRDAGCTKAELVAHIESQWIEGMSWGNYGRKPGVRCWEIDHILPLSSFDLEDREQLLRACHYTNLQPLWWEDNREKANKIL